MVFCQVAAADGLVHPVLMGGLSFLGNPSLLSRTLLLLRRSVPPVVVKAVLSCLGLRLRTVSLGDLASDLVRVWSMRFLAVRLTRQSKATRCGR
jgi:xanthine/uracil permease